MNTRLLWLAVPLLAALLLGGANLALAKKPVPPPPSPPDPADVGVVYFVHSNSMYAMDTDGTGKDEITITQFAGGTEYRPSQALHGGEQWFLQKRAVVPMVFDPCGKPRHEIYAVSESDVHVLLFSEENVDFQYTGSIGWTTHDGVPDGKVSFAARRFVEDPDSTVGPEGYSVGEYGIFVATLDPESLPTAGASLDLEWTLLPIEFYLKQELAFSVEYDWSPDGTAFVCQERYDPVGGIWLAEDDGLDWTTTQLTTGGGGPRWSNDGTRIAFLYGGEVCTMDDEGSNIVTVVQNPEDTRKTITYLTGPFVWSPNDTHLLYGFIETYIKYDRRLPAPPLKRIDIFRVELTESGGTDDVCLTEDTGAWVQNIGWRE